MNANVIGPLILGVIMFAPIVMIVYYILTSPFKKYSLRKGYLKDDLRIKYANLHRQNKSFILDSDTRESLTQLSTDLKRQKHLLSVNRKNLSDINENRKNYNVFSTAEFLDMMAENDDALAFVNKELGRIEQLQSKKFNTTNIGNNTSGGQNQEDNVRKSQPQQQPNWNQQTNQNSSNSQSSNHQSQQQPNWQQPSGNNNLNLQKSNNLIKKEDIINGFVNCGYSRSEGERIFRNYGKDEAFKKLCDVGLEFLKQNETLSESDTKRLMGNKGLLGTLDELRKKLPPPSES